MTEKQLELKRAISLKDKAERIKALTDYMFKYVTPTEKSKANVYADATVIFNGRLL